MKEETAKFGKLGIDDWHIIPIKKWKGQQQ